LRHVDSRYLDSNQVFEGRPGTISRLRYRFSDSFMMHRDAQGLYEATITLKANQAVPNLGIILFHENGNQLKKVGHLNLEADEAQTFKTSFNFKTKQYDGIGYSSYQVPIGTIIDLVAISIRKIS